MEEGRVAPDAMLRNGISKDALFMYKFCSIIFYYTIPFYIMSHYNYSILFYIVPRLICRNFDPSPRSLRSLRSLGSETSDLGLGCPLAGDRGILKRASLALRMAWGLKFKDYMP